MDSINRAALEEDRAAYEVNLERAAGRRQRAEEEMLRIDGALMYIEQLVQFLKRETQNEADEVQEVEEEEDNEE